MNDNDLWHPYNQGRTIGQRGTEDGIILRDEEHSAGSQITLERDPRSIPFAITCGIYCWLFHTRYCESIEQAEADFARMKAALPRILQLIPARNDPKVAAQTPTIRAALEDFAFRQFP